MSDSSDYLEFGFGSEGETKLGGGKFERFKAREGENYRMSFAWWPLDKEGKPNLDADSPNFVGVKRHYIQGVGYVLDKGPELAKLAGGPAKAAIATIIVIWPTDRKGNIDKNRFVSGDVDVQPWVFSRTIYDQLARRHSEFPFGSADISVACTDTQFQKMDISPCKESLFRKALTDERMKGTASAILGKVNEIAAEVKRMLAQDLSVEKVREKLGGPAAGNSGFTAAATSEVDGLLDDLVPE